MRLPRRFSLSLVCLAVVGLAAIGCVAGRRPLTVNQRIAIQRRAEVGFPSAVLLKPAEPASANSLAYRLSPLIVQEVTASDATSGEASPLLVLCAEGEMLVAGKRHQQVSFVWSQRVPASRGAKTPTVWQGIRITLNSAGQPTIWEVLRDGSGAHIFFVAQSVEVAALKQSGPPPPGRRFAVERALGETPTVVVARVIDDGPVPMGPIVHVDARGDITTVNCRCMPTQAQQLVAQGGYGLVTDPSALEAWPPSQRLADSAHLAQVLRLPSNF